MIIDQLERDGSRPERRYQAIPARDRSKAWKALAVVPLLLIAVAQLVLFLKVHAREQALAENGVTTTAVVVDDGYHGDTDYLRVQVPECGCIVEVATTDAEAHPPGSTLPVRYDPARPGRAKAMVDRPNPYEDLLAVSGGLALGVVILVPLLGQPAGDGAAPSRWSRPRPPPCRSGWRRGNEP